MKEKTTVIVQPTGKAEAKAALEEWKHHNPSIVEKLKPQDIITGVMRGEDGKTYYRICIITPNS
jgi:hypothetical protein